MLQVTVTLTFDLLTPKPIGIIYQSCLTKKPIIMSQSLIGFKLLSRQGFYAQGHCDLEGLTFDLPIPKWIGIIYGSWPSMIPRRVCLCEISLKLMSREEIANAGHRLETDGQTDKRHNIIRPKVPSGV